MSVLRAKIRIGEMIVRPAMTRPGGAAKTGAELPAEELVFTIHIRAARVGIDAAVVATRKHSDNLPLVIDLINNEDGLRPVAEVTDGAVRRHRPARRETLDHCAAHLAGAVANHGFLVEEALVPARAEPRDAFRRGHGVLVRRAALLLALSVQAQRRALVLHLQDAEVNFALVHNI